ncbi:Vacuolar protein sorting-associated protein 41 [Rhodosporidiobolus nylandii]
MAPSRPSSIASFSVALSASSPAAPILSTSSSSVGPSPSLAAARSPPPASTAAPLDIAKGDVVPSTSGLHSVSSQGSAAKRPPEEGERNDEQGSSGSESGEDEEEREGTPEQDAVRIEKEDGEEEPPDPASQEEEGEREGASSPSSASEMGGESRDEVNGADEEEEEEEEDEAGEEEDDEEPTLKYSRFGGASGGDLLSGKDTASAVTVCGKYIVLGTHNGAILVLTPEGKLVKRWQPHQAMVMDLSVDHGSEFVASASMDGRVAIHALPLSASASEPPQVFDLGRPLRCVALDPHFGRRSARQFVSGGMAGALILSEKGWLGHKDVTLHSGEGPVWAAEWRGTFIAWASDAGIRIYDTASSQRITFISRPDDSPRADLFKCSLHWADDRTLLIAWADFIKVAVVKEREAKRALPGVGGVIGAASELYGEVTAIFQLDCMVSGIAPYGADGDLLVLAYPTEEGDSDVGEEEDGEDAEEGEKDPPMPELRIISKDGEELSSDAISLRGYERFQCRDYSLVPSASSGYLVVAPMDAILVQPRDEEDHIVWLIEQGRYEDALAALEQSGMAAAGGFDVTDVGKKYLEFLVADGQFEKAAEACPKILGINAKLWEDWVFLFADKGQLKTTRCRIQTIIPFVPTHDPQLSQLVYEMILAHFLRHDQEALLRTIETWPPEIYDVSAVILALKDRLERAPNSKLLLQSVSELYILNRQPGRAIPCLLKLREPHVFALIRDHNLFTDVQDQALLLIEFDEDLRSKRSASEKEKEPLHGTAVELLVEHTHSIPIPRVVSQLQHNRKYLYMYLDALFDKDAHLAFDYSDLQVDLYAEYNPSKLMDFLRASSYYSLERAYKICDARDLVPEMVFLLGRMGDNKRALNLIIERLGDVQRAIEFAKEQNDNDLWEDLLKYSETKPRFIRGLLENVGVEIDPIRLIRRIKNGLEIPGLKPALIKILQDFQLQISLMEGCKSILYADCRQLALSLHGSQTNGFLWTGDTSDKLTGEPIYPHLAGGPVRFLSGPTYLSTSAFPSLLSPGENLSSLSLQPTRKRDQLVAAALLASLAQGDEDEDPGAEQRRAMDEKVRAVRELKARLAEERKKGRRAAVRIDVEE